MSSNFYKCSVLAAYSGNKIVEDTFEELWADRGWVDAYPPRLHTTGKAFIAVAPKPFLGKTYNKVYYLVVSEEVRRQGIATELLNSVPLPMMYVTECSNKAAIKLCESMGLELKSTKANEFGGNDYYYVKDIK